MPYDTHGRTWVRAPGRCVSVRVELLREPEQVTGCCFSLHALRQAANALRNLSTAANSARKALRTLTHGRAHGRAVHHQRAVNRGGLSPPPSSIVDSEAGEKGQKKFPIRGAIVCTPR